MLGEPACQENQGPCLPVPLAHVSGLAKNTECRRKAKQEGALSPLLVLVTVLVSQEDAGCLLHNLRFHT